MCLVIFAEQDCELPCSINGTYYTKLQAKLRGHITTWYWSNLERDSDPCSGWNNLKVHDIIQYFELSFIWKWSISFDSLESVGVCVLASRVADVHLDDHIQNHSRVKDVNKKSRR